MLLSALVNPSARSHRIACFAMALCLAVGLVPIAPAYAEEGISSSDSAPADRESIGEAASTVDAIASPLDGAGLANLAVTEADALVSEPLAADGAQSAEIGASESRPLEEGFSIRVAAQLRQFGSAAASARSTSSGVWGSVAWSFDSSNGTLTISGSGAMPAQTSQDTPGYCSFAWNITNIVISEGITSIGEAAFYQLYNVERVSLPSTLTAIGDGAFAECYSLASVNIPAKLTSIGAYAFQQTALQSVSLPASLTSLDSLAFFRCASLRSIDVSSGNRAFQSKGGVVYSKDGKTLLLYPAGKTGSFAIPAGVVKVGENACIWAGVQSVTIPSTVTTLESGAFTSSAITSVSIPSSVTSVGDYVFEDCTSLRSASLGNGLKKLGYRMFYGCSSLASINLGRVTDLDMLAFGYCTALKSVVIPSGVTAIKNGTFGECTALQSVSIPSTVKEIAYQAFLNCKSLTSLALPQGVEKIYRYAFALCTGLKSVRIPSTVTHIGEEAFPPTTKLTNLPSGLTRMEDGSYSILAKVAMKGKQCYSYAFQVLDRVNAERKKKGLKALVMDKSLLDAAMQRAMETTLYWSHTRPNGTDCFTVSDLMSGENIAAGQSSPKAVMGSWMNSPGHRANILSSEYASIGIGCVQVGHTLYWVQCFGRSKATAASKGSYKDGNKTRSVFVSPEKPYYQPSIKFSATRLKKKGATAKVTCSWYNGFMRVTVPATALAYKSSKSSVVSASKGVLKAKKSNGTATVKVYFPGYVKGAVSKTVVISPLAVPSLKSVKNAKGKKAVVTWKKVSGAAGYQVYYSTSSKFKGAKKVTVKNSRTVKKTLSKLKKGKTYYVKVRAYKKTGKKTQYSAWSSMKKVRITK